MSRFKISSIALLMALLFLLSACAGQGATEEVAQGDAAEQVAATPTNEANAEADEEAATTESSEPAAEGMRQFSVVPQESTASYIVDEEFLGGALAKLGIAAGAADVVGKTQEVSGQFEIDIANGSIGSNEFIVQMNTLTTDQDRRDRWIRTDGPRFNDFPIARFVATSIENAPDSYTDGEEVTFNLVGNLTVRETTIPTTFVVSAILSGDTVSGSATADLLMSDFGIDPPNFANTLTVADALKVKMDLVATEE